MHAVKKMKGLANWYPPAETNIPWTALVRSFFPGQADLETDLQKYLHVEACILGRSARALLSRLLTELQKTKDGSSRSQVLIPGYTCYSVAASVARAGLKIACYDLDPFTLEPVMDSIRAMTGEDTLAVVGQHLFGIPVDLDDLASHARQNGSYFIENAAQAFGGTRLGRQLGTQGDFGLFSFGRGKSLPLGSGGALIGDQGVLKNLDMAKAGPGYLDLFMAVANRCLADRRVYGVLEALPLGLGETIFDPGFPIQAMPDALKRLGRSSLQFLPQMNEHRKTIARIYHEILGERAMVTLRPEYSAVYTRFPIRAGAQLIPEKLIRLGVRRMYPKAILDEPSIRPYCSTNNITTPRSSIIAETLLTLPTHRDITLQIAAEIAEGIQEICW